MNALAADARPSARAKDRYRAALRWEPRGFARTRNLSSGSRFVCDPASCDALDWRVGRTWLAHATDWVYPADPATNSVVTAVDDRPFARARAIVGPSGVGSWVEPWAALPYEHRVARWDGLAESRAATVRAPRR